MLAAVTLTLSFGELFALSVCNSFPVGLWAATKQQSAVFLCRNAADEHYANTWVMHKVLHGGDKMSHRRIVSSHLSLVSRCSCFWSVCDSIGDWCHPAGHWLSHAFLPYSVQTQLYSPRCVLWKEPLHHQRHLLWSGSTCHSVCQVMPGMFKLCENISQPVKIIKIVRFALPSVFFSCVGSSVVTCIKCFPPFKCLTVASFASLV